MEKVVHGSRSDNQHNQSDTQPSTVLLELSLASGAVLSTHTHTTCHTYSQSFQNLVYKITLTTRTSDQLLIFLYWPLTFLVTRTTPLPSLAGSTPTVRFCTRPLLRKVLRPFRLLASCRNPEYVSHYQQHINNCKHLINWHSENQHRTFCNLKQNEALSTHPESTKRIKQQGKQQPRPDSPTLTVTLMIIQCTVNHDGSIRKKIPPGML